MKQSILTLVLLQVPHDFDTNFPAMRIWMLEFFKQHPCLVASQPGKNMLIKEVIPYI